jgi:hypothetical protein
MSAEPLPLATPTTITVRVIARDGKFLGDDIGGAHITVRDALTREILAQGVTSGGSGPNNKGGVMCAALRRGQPLPTTGASSFNAVLQLTGPRRVEVTAFGPLGARGSANTVSATQWVYPGKNITEGNGFLLELPGLIVQIISPPTHYAPPSLPRLEIVANVAMMCGCPISPKTTGQICSDPTVPQPWLPEEFEVVASIQGQTGPAHTGTLSYNSPEGVPGRFTGAWQSPPPGIYTITVFAWQKSTGNTGVDTATFIVPSPPSP